jgi:hypothetical protein
VRGTIPKLGSLGKIPIGCRVGMLSVLDRLKSNKPRKFAPEIVDRFVSKISESSYDPEDLEGVDLNPMYVMFDAETWEVFNPQAWIRKASPSNSPF